MDNFRKTLAYKICGYSFFVFIVFAVIFAIYVLANTSTWHDLTLIVLVIGIFMSAPKIIIPIFIVLSLIAFITKSQNTNKKCSGIADIGYISMLVISIMYLFSLPNIYRENIKKKESESAIQKEMHVVTKSACKMLNKNLPHIAEKLDTDFSKELLAEELSKLDNITGAGSYYNVDGLDFYYSEPSSFEGKVPINAMIKTTSNKICDINKKNCYIYAYSYMDKNFYDCKFYFDKKGRIIPSEKTLEFIK